MISIFKYTLPDRFSDVTMPEGAKILSVYNQDDSICIWALVDTEKAIEVRRFYVATTGEELTEATIENWKFIGTILMNGGVFVLHTFEVPSV